MLPDHLVHLLRTQHGVGARHQVRALEPSEHARRSIYRHPDLTWRSSRVFRHCAAPWTIEQDLMAGVLDCGRGAALWGKPAASHWGFSRFRRLPAHAATPRRRTRGSTLAQVHQVRHLDARDLTTHLDIPIARPEVVVLWLAGMWTHRLGHDLALLRTAVVLDQAWRQGLIDGDFVHDLAARSGGFGRSGIVVFRQALDTRPPGYKPAGSRLEERFEEVVSWNVRSQLERQVTVDVEPTIRTVDFRLQRWPLVVEINGEAFHTSLTDRAADEERYARMLELGFSVVVFWEHDIWNDVALVRDTMSRLLACPDEVPTLHRPSPAPWTC